MQQSEKKNRAKECARDCLDHIKELLKRYDAANEKEDDVAIEKAETELRESHYGVQVRSAWTDPYGTMEPAEYIITLAGGGPAVRLCGMFRDFFPIPDMPRLEYQDWFTPWERYEEMTPEEEKMLEYYATVLLP